MKNIVLTGYMASGKTTIGSALANNMGYRFIDVDKLIVEHEKKTINDIFDSMGEKYFREIETQVIEKISDTENAVIATGGGVVLKKINMDTLRKNGIIFFIDTPIDAIIKRLSRSNTGRPLVDNVGAEQIRERYERRQKYYNNYDYRIETQNKTLGMIINEIKNTYTQAIDKLGKD